MKIKRIFLVIISIVIGFICSEGSTLATGANEWKVKGIVTEKAGYQLNEEILLETEVDGNSEGLRYKYVWMKDNWAQWGVLREFDEQSSVEWKPQSPGEYTVIADVKGTDGKVVTVNKKINVTWPVWEYIGLDVNENQACEVDKEISLSVNMTGNTTGIQYKFVWMKDGWAEWGVVQPFSENNKAVFVPENPGNYTFIVDIKDVKGTVTTKQISVRVYTEGWNFEEIKTSPQSPQEKYSGQITLEAVTSGATDNLKYKYVWMKDGWAKWGVLREFSADSKVEWTPEEAGKYTLFVDIKDKDGFVQTKSITYEITPVQWSLDEIVISPENEQERGAEASIDVKVSGNTTGLLYKFVWMRDDWSEWGVIREFGEDSHVEWKTPKKSGTYTIFVNVKDRDKETRTMTKEYSLVSQIWSLDGIDINAGVSEQIYRNIPVKAEVSGNTEDLLYKYVWMKDDWAEWGVIRDFDEEKEATWFPKKPGTYQIITNVKDTDGKVRTFTQDYEVLEAPWKLDEIQVEAEGSYFVGDTTTVTAVTSGETEGLQYKFVQRNGSDWSDWKVLQDFSSNNTVEVNIEKAGDCTIYVDIKDATGVTFEAQTKVLQGHEYLSAKSELTKVTLGRTTTLYPKLSGSPKGMECRYVWMKDNWAEWGVLSEFSNQTSIEWKPEELGTYYIYIDVKLNGIQKSQMVQVDVVKEKYGWYYEDGYKFYYVNGVKQKDIRNLMGENASYEIKINKQQNCITVYTQDGNNGYITPVVSFVCSTGYATPVGTFYTPARYRWLELMGPCWGQWCTQIVSDFLFHSVYYNSYNNNMTLAVGEYNKLGTTASHGCVRLTAGDAKWIYDNCKLRTKVVIYNSSYAGPLGKPSAMKLPSYHTWDPTDPVAYAKCRARGCH